MLQVVRGYAATIRANLAVSDANKADLGLHVHDTQPTPIPPPATYPVLSVVGMGAGLQDLRACDQNTPDKRGKPVGASGLLVYRAVGTAPATDPAQAVFLAFVSRSDFQSTFTSTDAGKTATYFGRWTNGKGEGRAVGPGGQRAPSRRKAGFNTEHAEGTEEGRGKRSGWERADPPSGFDPLPCLSL